MSAILYAAALLLALLVGAGAGWAMTRMHDARMERRHLAAFQAAFRAAMTDRPEWTEIRDGQWTWTGYDGTDPVDASWNDTKSMFDHIRDPETR